MITPNYSVSRASLAELNLYASGRSHGPFTGEGWYHTPGESVYILIVVDIDRLWHLFSWDHDPRPAMRDAILLPDKGPVKT